MALDRLGTTDLQFHHHCEERRATSVTGFIEIVVAREFARLEKAGHGTGSG